MSRLQKERFLQVLLNHMNLSLIINILQQLIGIMGYQNTSTCWSKENAICDLLHPQFKNAMQAIDHIKQVL